MKVQSKGLAVHGATEKLDAYSETCLRRVWRAQDFSTSMTTLLHRLSDDAFDEGLQRARRQYVCTSEAAARSLAEKLRRPPAHVKRGNDTQEDGTPETRAMAGVVRMPGDDHPVEDGDEAVRVSGEKRRAD